MNTRLFSQLISLLFFIITVTVDCFSQDKDTIIRVDGKLITLSEIVVNNKLNVPAFIDRVKNDTSFYKAFKNLRILGFTAINDVRMLDKKGRIQASLISRTKQRRSANCRFMDIVAEQVTGDMYDKNGDINYYTGQLYASLFFTKDSICGETNIVAGREFTTSGLKGMEKHKEQLRKLFFNPGKKISGIPFIGDKTAIFDEDMADKYDMQIDMDLYNKISCYVFTIKAIKKGVVIDEMITWFDDKNFEIVARKYKISYDATVYDFDVQMEVEMTRVNNLTVPSLLRYNGNWKAITKKRERGIFTATLFDFTY